MKKFLALLLVMVMCVAAGIGGTVAYLTDTDEAVNVMTVGNVSIEQHEYQRAEGVAYDAGEPGAGNGVKEGALVPYVNGQRLYPAYPAEDGAYTAEMDVAKIFYWGDYVYSGTAGNGLWNDAKLVGAMDKMVFVENTGNTDAYFRTVIAFECPEGMEYSEGPDKEFMMNVNGSDLYDWEGVGYVTIDGVRYWVECATYLKPLEPGQQAHPSLLQVVMTHNATNEDMELIGDTYEILVLSQAVQTENLPSAAVALDVAFPKGENNANVAGWFTGDDGKVEVPVVAKAKDNKELDEAIKDGADILVLESGNYIIPDSAQGKTLTIVGNGKDTVIATQDDGSYEGCDYSLDGATVTFEGVTINTDSTTYTGYARCNGTYNNCTINGTYTLYGDSVFNNCTFNVDGDVYNIWTWGAPTATFNNCTFNSDGKALLLYGQANTKLTVNNCEFNDKGGLTDKKAAIEIGNDYNKSYELIVNNTTVNGYEINDKGINTGTTLWGNKNSMGTDKLNVVVDGVDVY